MKVALEVWSADYEQVLSTCLLAETLGLDGFYYGESPHGLNLDCWTTLAGLASATERIRLGPVITNILPTYRSALLLAKQAATVAAISRGRIEVRTGVGAAARFGRAWWRPFGIDYPGYEQRLSDLEAFLEELPALLAGQQPPAESGSSAENDLAIPLTVAASGERAMRLAATVADVWETSFCSPAEFLTRNARFSELAAGRAVVRSLEVDGFVSCTSNGAQELLDRVRTERGGSEDLGPVFARAIVGVPSEAAQHLRALSSAGVDQAVVALHDPHDRDALEAIAETAELLRT